MKIGLIGFGSLGKAFVSGLLKSGFNHENIGITAKTQKTINLAKELYPKINVFSDKSKLIDFSDVIILCVEPQNTKELCQELDYQQMREKILISCISGVLVQDLLNYLNCDMSELHIIRAMPNLAISNCEGITGLVDSSVDGKRAEQFMDVKALFEGLGYVAIVRENELEAITVSSACGMAFASVLLNVYQDAIMRLLNNAAVSKEITLQLFMGVISLIRDEDISFQQLNDIVATKKGSTEVGLNNFDTDAIDHILKVALHATYERTKTVKDNQ